MASPHLHVVEDLEKQALRQRIAYQRTIVAYLSRLVSQSRDSAEKQIFDRRLRMETLAILRLLGRETEPAGGLEQILIDAELAEANLSGDDGYGLTFTSKATSKPSSGKMSSGSTGTRSATASSKPLTATAPKTTTERTATLHTMSVPSSSSSSYSVSAPTSTTPAPTLNTTAMPTTPFSSAPATSATSAADPYETTSTTAAPTTSTSTASSGSTSSGSASAPASFTPSSLSESAPARTSTALALPSEFEAEESGGWSRNTKIVVGVGGVLLVLGTVAYFTRSKK